MEQNINNPINSVENNNNSNLKKQYNDLKQKIENLEKNNREILEMYKAEEQRLIKSNEFLMQKNNHDNSRNIKDLEAEVLKMRNAIRQLQNIMEPKNGNNLIENDNLSSKSNNHKLNDSTEEKIKEEYLNNYKNKLKIEFEKKLIMKHQELIDYCTEQNKKIIENNLNQENIIDIDEIKFFSIKNEPKEKNYSNEQSSFSEAGDLDIDKINLILNLFCLKEEYPKDFFIDYILDESYSERGYNKNKSINVNQNKMAENIKKSTIKRSKRQSARIISHEIDVFKNNNNKIAEKICQLFDIKNQEDIDLIKLYINEVFKYDNSLRNYFEKNLNKYRFAPYENYEKEKYDEKIKICFGSLKDEIKNLLNIDENIISLQTFMDFLDKYLKEEDKENEFIFYMMYLMKLSKSEKKNEKSERLKSLRIFEFNLMPLYQKLL